MEMIDDKLTRVGHIRVLIQSDYTSDNWMLHFNDSETALYATMDDNEIRSIVLEDKAYHELVVKILERFIESYKIKYLTGEDTNE